MVNPFFKNTGPFKIHEILNLLHLDTKNVSPDIIINDIKDLSSSKEKDITFFHSKKYKSIANNTKALFCITTENLKNDLPNSCTPIVVENVLIATSKVTTKFYPNSIDDNFDLLLRI